MAEMGEEPVSEPLGRIALVGTGGTISAWSPATLDLTGYTEAEDQRLTLAELVAAVPDLERVAEVVQIPAEAGPSHALDLAGLLGVAGEVRRARERPGVRGVVVAHGTNTLEELAFLLDLVLGPGTPVVLTAAMRPLSALSGDGPLNLVNAARVALCPAAAGRGALVVVDDAIWSARRVAKTGTAGTGAFGGLGPLGEVDPGGQVRFRFAEEHSAPILPVTETTSVPRVDVVVSYPGADGALIDAAVAAGARGLVSAGTGAGFPTPAEVTALRRAAEAGVVVCQSYRGASGGVRPSARLRADGFVAGQDLSPYKCRVLLALALAAGAGRAGIQDLFDTFGGR